MIRRLTLAELAEYQALSESAKRLHALLAELHDLTPQITGEDSARP